MGTGKGIVGRFGAHVRGNVVGYVALFVALCGTAYAAGRPLFDEKGSVTSFNVKNKTVKRADVSKGLRNRLGLSVPAPPQPRAGIYTGTTTDAESGQQVTVKVAWVGDDPAVPIQVEFTSAAPFCNYTTPNDALIANAGGGVFAYRSAQGPKEVLIEVAYHERTVTLFREAAIIDPGVNVCAPQPVFLRPQ